MCPKGTFDLLSEQTHIQSWKRDVCAKNICVSLALKSENHSVVRSLWNCTPVAQGLAEMEKNEREMCFELFAKTETRSSAAHFNES